MTKTGGKKSRRVFFKINKKFKKHYTHTNVIFMKNSSYIDNVRKNNVPTF